MEKIVNNFSAMIDLKVFFSENLIRLKNFLH